MATTDTAAQLLIVALQDLYDGKRDAAARLPRLARKAGARLAAWLGEDAHDTEAQAERLGALLDGVGAPRAKARNIWLRAIMKDARRDARTIARGPLRDVALIGALRKGKQASRVSHETALALARTLGHGDAATALEAMRDADAAADGALAAMLADRVSACR